VIDHTFVKQQRARGFSWQAIAKQLGCCELDLRNECDPSRRLPLPVRPAAVKAPEPLSPSAARRAATPSHQFKGSILRLVANGLTPKQAAEDLGISHNVVRGVLHRARRSA